MPSRTKRTYSSASRDARAKQTRSSILESAKKLFQSEGFEMVTIEKIAQAAQVSVPTIYALFQSKRGIVRAVLDEALSSDQFYTLVEITRGDIPAHKRLAMSAKIARQIYDAEREQMEIFRGASVLSPELKELEREREERRYIRQEETIKRLAQEKSLKKGLGESKARDILWALTGRDMYRLFVVERGWSSDEYEEWLAQLLSKTLLEAE